MCRAQYYFITETEAIGTRKRLNLPGVFWNATFASPEFRTLMNTDAEPLVRDVEPAVADITDVPGKKCSGNVI